ncbi:GFA family protein [Rhizobium sullae]|uniref:CENP-V/GFA domain-containing protein n=1 Tax=Rhizobium sullae TaxID=50338 RepID=A0A4R3Q1V1_RHISU|nr:GFA family protein [Rhizobium sullae]TCU13082.1 hypothetical protein EV132_11365 [Rhizobium sullae]
MRTRTGGCLCGAVRYEVKGEPLRAGLCHCADCRKESGSAFVTFAVWRREAFDHSGPAATYQGRSFCPVCGGRLFCLTDEEAELRLGSLDDAPMEIAPLYEIWIKRRESWLHPLQRTDQYQEDAG